MSCNGISDILCAPHPTQRPDNSRGGSSVGAGNATCLRMPDNEHPILLDTKHEDVFGIRRETVTEVAVYKPVYISTSIMEEESAMTEFYC